MRIPISPQEIVNAVVGNNPTAVQENMLRNGLGQASPLTPQGFMEMLSNLQMDSRAQAVRLMGKLFNIQVDNNGYAAPWLYQMTTSYGMSLEQLTNSIFDAYLPAEISQGGTQELPRILSQEMTKDTDESVSDCGCSKGKHQRAKGTAVAPITLRTKTLGLLFLALAAFGLIALIALSVRVVMKLSKI